MFGSDRPPRVESLKSGNHQKQEFAGETQITVANVRTHEAQSLTQKPSGRGK